MIYETVKLALQAILRNALRSSLTVLGVVIGVGAVIAMITIGNGTTAKVTADLPNSAATCFSFGLGSSDQVAPALTQSHAPLVTTRP